MLHLKISNCRCPNIMINRLFSSKLLACYSKWCPCPRTNYSKNLKHPIIYSLICFVLILSTKLVMASAPNISWISSSMGSQQRLNARNVHGKTTTAASPTTTATATATATRTAKNDRSRLAKQQLYTCIMYISLPSWDDCHVKLPVFTFCGWREHKTTTLFLFSSTSIQSFRI